MIRNKDLDNLAGQMEDATKDNGKMVNKMEKEHIKINKEFKKMEFGSMVKRWNGVTDL